MEERTNIAGRVARNTLMLYARMVLLLLVGLYTSRVILRTLGQDDFGVYTAVGGVVALFSVLTGSMSSAISRFMTFELGKREGADPHTVFNTAVTIQIVLAGVIVLLSEPIGLWWLHAKMNIPPDRMGAAFWVLQLSLLTFVANLLSVPYNAAIIAHEKMDAFAYIGVLEGLLKLLTAFLVAISPIDRLVFYAALMAGVSILVRLIYGVYCRLRFEEARYCFRFDRRYFREMFSFAGWNMIGSGSAVLRDQGGNQLLNLFFGPAVNAGWGFATQISTGVQRFVSSFITAINPQITKSWAAGERDTMMRLVFKGSRMSVYLLLLLALPILANTGWLTDLWLGKGLVPPHTVNFIRLVLIYILVESVSYTMVTAMLSTGKIRSYQIVVGGIQLLNVPVAYILLRCGAEPEAIYWTAIALALCCLAARLFMLRGMIGLDVRSFLKKVILNELVVVIAASVLPLWMAFSMEPKLVNVLLNCLLCVISTGLSVWLLGLSADERKEASGMIRRKLFRK